MAVTSGGRPSPAQLIPPDLAARIRAVLPSLPPAEARVALLIDAEPTGVAALTVGKLAERARTSAATVVRTARSLGFEGYPQLRLALAALGGSLQADDAVPLGAEITDADPVGLVLAKLAAFESEQIRATADLVDPAALGAVIESIGAARRIDVYGIGASGLVAQDLTQKLCRIGLECRAHTEHDAAMVSACLLGPADIAIGVSHSGENRGTVKPVALAHRAGASTAAITGSARSALARSADHVLVTAGREFGFRSAAMASRTGQLLVVDAIFSGVARSLPGALLALQRTHDSVSSGSGRARPAKGTPSS